MKRTVHVIIKLKAEIDDDREGVPFGDGMMYEIFASVAKAIPGCVAYLPGATLSVGLDRASALAARKKSRAHSTAALLRASSTTQQKLSSR